MPKLWVIAKHEYLKITRKRSFLFGTLAMPLFFVAIMAFAIVMVVASEDQRPIGYVDHAGLLIDGDLSCRRMKMTVRSPVELLAFADEAQARAALDDKQIQAYYVLPADYLTSHNAQSDLLGQSSRRGSAQRRFDNLVRANLVGSLPADVAAARAATASILTARSADGRQEVSGESFINIFVPFFIGLFFSIVVLSSGTYMLEAVTDEKENRTIEVMTTSLTPGQLIGGKAIGLMAVALTQIGILVITIVRRRDRRRAVYRSAARPSAFRGACS